MNSTLRNVGRGIEHVNVAASGEKKLVDTVSIAVGLLHTLISTAASLESTTSETAVALRRMGDHELQKNYFDPLIKEIVQQLTRALGGTLMSTKEQTHAEAQAVLNRVEALLDKKGTLAISESHITAIAASVAHILNKTITGVDGHMDEFLDQLDRAYSDLVKDIRSYLTEQKVHTLDANTLQHMLGARDEYILKEIRTMLNDNAHRNHESTLQRVMSLFSGDQFSEKGAAQIIDAVASLGRAFPEQREHIQKAFSGMLNKHVDTVLERIGMLDEKTDEQSTKLDEALVLLRHLKDHGYSDILQKHDAAVIHALEKRFDAVAENHKGVVSVLELIQKAVELLPTSEAFQRFLSEHTAQLTEQIAHLETREEAQAGRRALSGLVGALQASNSAELSRVTGTLRTLLGELGDIYERSGNDHVRIRDLERELDRLQRSVEELAAENEQLQQGAFAESVWESRLRKAQGDLMRVSSELSQAYHDNARVINDNDALTAAVGKLRDEIADLNARLSVKGRFRSGLKHVPIAALRAKKSEAAAAREKEIAEKRRELEVLMQSIRADMSHAQGLLQAFPCRTAREFIDSVHDIKEFIDDTYTHATKEQRQQARGFVSRWESRVVKLQIEIGMLERRAFPNTRTDNSAA